jgi:hypothetical protein
MYNNDARRMLVVLLVHRRIGRQSDLEQIHCKLVVYQKYMNRCEVAYQSIKVFENGSAAI